jgi:hypothetical protein
MAERHFGNCAAALLDDVEQQIFMFGRIDFVVSARQHSDCAGIERHAMRRLIDAACEARCDGKSRIAEIPRDGLRELQSCADALREPTMPIIGWVWTLRTPRTPSSGRVVDQGEAGRIAVFAGCEQCDPIRLLFSISRSASACVQMRPAFDAPPRCARWGRRSSAARALPK